MEALVRAVWRRSLNEPGYAVVPVPVGVSSLALRESMREIIEQFHRVLGITFVPERLGRFDQQVTTKFHRDGAPAASLLILGYEPSTVKSRLFVADACRAAAAEQLGANAFLAANNPMFPKGEAKLQAFITELHIPPESGAIVIINNSLYPDDATSPIYGLLHKAEIVEPDPTATRVINSMGLTPVGPELRTLPHEAVSRFYTRMDLD